MGLEPTYLRKIGAGLEPVAVPLQLLEEKSARPKPSSDVDALYRQEAPAIRLFVKRMVRNRSDAEDIVQETFLRAWPSLASGMITCPRAFLFRTARNLALNHIRNDRVRNSDSARAASDDLFQRRVPTAEDQLIASEEAAACQRLLDELPLRCREAFVLRVVDELSYKQMSKSMRLSVSTVEKHVGKGKQICRSLLLGEKSTGDHAPEILMSRIPARKSAGTDARRALAFAAE